VSEYEILDSDAFDEDRYWDIFVEVRAFPLSFPDDMISLL
jgi:hypothetical protein